MTSRIQKLVLSFPAHSIDAFLVTSDTNMTYLTGYPCSESWLLVHARKIYYITDGRYASEVRGQLKGISIHEYRDSRLTALAELLKNMRVRRLGLDDRHISAHAFQKFKNSLKSIKLTSCDNLVETMRMVKEPGEISKIREAVRWNLKAFSYLKKIMEPGMTEEEVLLRLEDFVRHHGVGFSFPPIIASGPQSGFPHARVTDRKIRNHQPVLVDMGIAFQGYKSDLTRMFFLGRIPPLVQEITEIVLTAQREAIAHIRPGVPAKEIDRQARCYFQRHDLEKNFLHSLGHGIGLEVHEQPGISRKSDVVLKQGMVFTVEPAVYFPKKFGIRIEDMVLVTKHGCEILSR